MINMRKSGLFILGLAICGASHADSIRDAGDYGRFLIPVASAASALCLHDVQGFRQLTFALVLTTGVTEGLKIITKEPRPLSGTKDSFPSGHASIAFTGASFIHHRYGFQYSIPFYLASSFVGYSRVHAKSHYSHDVIAGAGIGFLSAWASTTPWMGRDLAFVWNREYAGFVYRKLFD